MVSISKQSEPEQSKGAGVAIRAPGGGKIKKLLSMGGTFLTVVVLTGLLWVWAEQSQLKTKEIPLSFVLATGADSSLVLLSVNDGFGQEARDDTATGGKRIREVKVVFEGTRNRLRELQADRQSGKLKLLSYLSEVTYGTGEHKIAVIDLLNANDELRARGITVVKAEPENIRVTLDKWVRIKIKLALKAKAQGQRFNASIEPPEIEVGVPSTLKDVLQPEELLVDLVGADPERITPGMKVPATVSGKLGGFAVRPTLLKVIVTLRPRKQSDDKLEGLPLYAILPVDMINKYNVMFGEDADKIVNVTVVGPTAELEKLKTASQEKVRAYIRLGSKHIKSPSMDGYYTITVEFELDEDVHEVDVSGSPKTVKVRLEKKPTD
jgi:hypothetical protein